MILFGTAIEPGGEPQLAANQENGPVQLTLTGKQGSRYAIECAPRSPGGTSENSPAIHRWGQRMMLSESRMDERISSGTFGAFEARLSVVPPGLYRRRPLTQR